MSVQGQLLSQLGQAVSPAQLAQAYSAFQDIQVKAQQQKRFEQSLAQYDEAGKSRSKRVQAFFSRAEKLNPSFRNDAKSFQQHNVAASSPAELFKMMEGTKEFGFTEAELDMFHQRALADLRAAPQMLAKAMDDRRKLLRSEALGQSVANVATEIAEGNLTLADAIKSGMSNEQRELLIEQLRSLRQEQSATRQDDETATGIAHLAKNIVPVGSTFEEFRQAMVDSGFKSFGTVEGVGKAQLAFDTMNRLQGQEADEVAAERAEVELGLPKTTLNGRRIFNPGPPDVVDDRPSVQLDLPNAKPRESGLAFGLFADKSNVFTPTIVPGQSTDVHVVGPFHLEVDRATGNTRALTHKGRKVTGDTAIKKAMKLAIMADFTKDTGNMFGKVASFEDAVVLANDLRDDLTYIDGGIAKALRDTSLPEATIKKLNATRDLVSDIRKESVKKIETFVDLESGESLSTVPNISRSNFREDTAELVQKILTLQTEYHKAFTNVRTGK